MATASASGYDCEFERSPPEGVTVTCPICLLVLRDPQQMKCCGKITCDVCITMALSGGSSCPMCNNQHPQHWPDMNRRQILCGLRVFCPHRVKDGGCHWNGELGSLDAHLNANPCPSECLNGCQYTILDCQLCKKSMQRQKLQAHQQNECLERPFTCKYCTLTDSYSKIINVHRPSCPKEPVSCQYCGKKYERQKLKNHVTNQCGFVEVPCDFSVVGCKVVLIRKNMASHQKESIESHVALLHSHLKSSSKPTEEYYILFVQCLEQLALAKQQMRSDLVQMEKLQEKMKNIQMGSVAVIVMIIICIVFSWMISS